MAKIKDHAACADQEPNKKRPTSISRKRQADDEPLSQERQSFMALHAV